MTEAEWDGCTSPNDMLELLWEVPHPDRKWRAFACACSRGAWDLLIDPRSRRGVEVAELALDGLAARREMAVAARDAEAAWRAAKSPDGPRIGRFIYPAEAVALLTDWERPAVVEVASGASCLTKGGGESPLQAGPLRCVFGPVMFGEVVIDPAWLAWEGGVAVHLAEAIYADAGFDRLPILADALEEGGCDNGGLLGHLRGPGPYPLGCWALEAVLGRT